MKKQENYFRSNKFILVMIVVAFCFSAVPAWAEKQDAKVNVKNDSKANLPSPANTTKKSICEQVTKILKDESIKKYTLEKEECEYEDNLGDSRCIKYKNIDLDGDRKADKIINSWGSSDDSFLTVKLSNGGNYDLDEDGFISLLKLEGKIYALVTYYKWDRLQDGSAKGTEDGNRLYELTKQNAELICDKENLKRR